LKAPLPGLPLTIEELRVTPVFASSVPTRDIKIPVRHGVNLDCRIYRPNNLEAAPLFIYFHGGGWVRGTLDSYNYICGRISEQGFIVASVAYRLCPEHPYPIPTDDCIDSINWLLKNTSSLMEGYNERVVIGGDSAGAHLTLSALLKMLEKDGHLPPQIVAECLIYPATDSHMTSPCWATLGKDYRLTEEFVIKTWIWLTGGNEQLKDDPFVCICKCNDSLLSKLPPTLVITAEFDPLFEEGEKFSERLFSLGINIHCFRVLSTVHGFFSQASATGMPVHEPYSNLALQIISIRNQTD